MKRTSFNAAAVQTAALSRPDTAQQVLRLFAASTARAVPERLRYLARPHYRLIGGKPVTLAGDGRVFLWAHGRVPGFADYEIPPGGFGYVDMPAILALHRGPAQIDAPAPAGGWKGQAHDEVVVSNFPALVHRYDLARLMLLDTVRLGPGEPYKRGSWQTSWCTLALTWKHGTASGAGLVFCKLPRKP